MNQAAAPIYSHWRTVEPTVPVLHRWVDNCVVFNPLSGHTHLLDSISGELLQKLMTRAQSTSVLRTHVADVQGLANDDELAERIDDILQGLDDVGLIELAPAC